MMSGFFEGPPPVLASAGPKYLRISRFLSDAVESGRLAVDDALPSQRELAAHFDVTLMTIRQALNVLAEDGLLRVEHGRGTFVARSAQALPLDGLASFADQMLRAGRDLRNEILGAEEITAPPGVPSRMRLAGTRVFCLTRLRRVDGRPLVHSMSLLEPSIGRLLDLEHVVRVSLYAELARHDIVVATASETFRADLMTPEQAAALERASGSPALVNSRLTYTRDGVPVVDDRAVMPGEAVYVTTERRTDETDTRFALTDFPAHPAARHPHP